MARNSTHSASFNSLQPCTLLLIFSGHGEPRGIEYSAMSLGNLRQLPMQVAISMGEQRHAAQRAEIRERLAGSAEKYRTLRHARRDLVHDELTAVSDVLTPEQREKARDYIEQRVMLAPMVLSVAQRLEAAADKLGLSEDQRKKIVETYKSYDQNYEDLDEQRRELLQSEYETIRDVLTAEQREKVHNFLQDRMIVLQVQVDPQDPDAMAMLKETIAERLQVVADKLGLTAEQRDKIKASQAQFLEKFAAQREKREALRKEELAAMGKILTDEQREQAKKFIADRTDGQ